MFSLFGRQKAKQPDLPENVGRAGEDIAAAFLRDLGYTILTANYRKKFGELDIVAEDGDTLVFVEVKSRTSGRFGSPFEAVDIRKQQRMIRAAHAYLADKNLFNRPARFDVVAVRFNQGATPKVDHLQNAFEISDK